MMNTCDAAVLVLTYNRPENLLKLIDLLRKYKIKNVYIHADGAKDLMSDKAKCDETRKVINDNADLFGGKVNLSSVNLGCTPATIGAINWVFESEESLMLLEDDCLPREHYFHFMNSMLMRYAENEKVFCVSGALPRLDFASDDSYFFSKFASAWGLGLWRRSWNHFDLSMKSLDWFIYSCSYSNRVFPTMRAKHYWFEKFESVKFAQGTSGWDYCWAFAVLLHDAYVIYPSRNLITNIGYVGVHGANHDSPWLGVPTESFEITEYPAHVSSNVQFEIELNELHVRLFHKTRLSTWIKYELPVVYFLLRSLKRFLLN